VVERLTPVRARAWQPVPDPGGALPDLGSAVVLTAHVPS
jgi:hypothetical protein